MRARLTGLLASLGELPAVPWPGLLTGPSWLLNDLPRPIAVLRWKLLPPMPGARYSGAVEHMLVAPRGVVVVGPGVLGAACGKNSARGYHPPPHGPSPVREALRRAHALQLWLDNCGRPEVPVLAAVCRQPRAGRGPAPVVVGNLWVGEAKELPAWLCSSRALGPAARASVVELLQEGLRDR